MLSRLTLWALILALLFVPATGLVHKHDSVSALDCGLCHAGLIAAVCDFAESTVRPADPVDPTPPAQLVTARNLDPLVARISGRAPPSASR